jgi:hypothetical protein
MSTSILIVWSLYRSKVIKIMPAHKNPVLLHNFIEARDPEGGKSEKYTCIHCKSYSCTNSKRAIEHLTKCPQYHQSLPTSLSNSLPNEPLEQPVKQQLTFQLEASTLSNIKKQKLDRAAALAIYMGAHPFTLFDDYYIRQFISLLSDSLYTTPNRRQISNDLLDEIYQDLQSKILSLLEQQKSLQFVLDESSDLNHHRMINISVVIPGFGSFYLENEHIGDQALNAQFFVDWFFKKTKIYCSDPRRMSSLTTDTCATMQKTWTGFKSYPVLSHAFFIPCDSHGLQLLIKDILESKLFSDTIAKAQLIVSTFYRAKKQYTILHTKQEKSIAFVLSVITRWGSQYGLTQSVLKNQQALFAWVADKRAQVGKKKQENTLRPLILDQDFWKDLSELAIILKPIHEAQKMSESNNASLAKVVPRWLQLEQDLKDLSQIYLYLKPVLASGSIFNTRFNTQTEPIHWAAFLLDPTSSLWFIDTKGRERAIM